jgi:hypothetical protein
MRTPMVRRFVSAAALSALIVATMAPAAVRAQPAPRPGEPTPAVRPVEKTKVEIPPQTRTYVEQTSAVVRERARKLFDEANAKFEQRQVDEALKMYRQVYAIWPHPRVLFNIAVTLGFLSQPLESARMFKTVLETGPEPVTPERYKQAAERYAELMGQLATLEVNCSEPGARVFIDGNPVGEAPLQTRVTVGPGNHQVTAERKGKIPFAASVRLEPGEDKTVPVVLQDFTDAVRYRTVSRYHWAVPTSVTAVAAIAVASGLGLLLSGRNDISDLQGQFKRDFDQQGRAVTYDQDRESRAVTYQQVGWGLLGVAGVAAIGGTVLWILMKKKVRYTLEQGGQGVQLRF